MSKHLEGIGITIFDADSRGGNANATLSSSIGTTTITVGDSGVEVTAGNGSAAVSFIGTIEELDNLFRGVTTGTVVFTSAATGAVTFTLTVTDEDNQSSAITFAGVVATFAAPVVTMPSGTLTPDVDTAFTLHGLTGWNITDADDAGGYGYMTIAITDGALVATTGTSGASLTDGTYDGVTYLNSSDRIRLEGTRAALLEFLQSPDNSTLYYVGTVAGAKSLDVTFVDENGQSSGVTSKLVTVATAPVVAAPGAFLAGLTGGTDVNIHGAGFSYTDTDNVSGDVNTVLITTDTGRLTAAAGTTGATIVTTGGFSNPSGGDATPAVIKITGTLTQINRMLTGANSGTIIFHKTTVGTSLVTVTVTDATGRTGANSTSVVMAASTTWTGYATATPTATTATVANYVYAVDLSLLPDAWWAIVSSDGRDIRVTHPVTGVDTMLPRDLVHFSVSAKTGTMFFKMDNNTSPDTVKIWAGASTSTAPAAGDTNGQHAVYDTNKIHAFWPDGGGLDRTSLDNDLTGVNSPDVGGVAADFGYATDYLGSAYSHLSGAGVGSSTPETFVSYVNASQRDSESVCGSTRGTITNRLIVSSKKAEAHTILSSATTGSETSKVRANAVGDVPNGSWQQIAATFASDSSRLAYRDGGNAGTDVNSKTGSAGTNRYFIGGTVKNASSVGSGFTAEKYFHGSIGLTFILAGLATSLVPVWIANSKAALSQATYWGTWSFVAASATESGNTLV